MAVIEILVSPVTLLDVGSIPTFLSSMEPEPAPDVDSILIYAVFQ